VSLVFTELVLLTLSKSILCDENLVNELVFLRTGSFLKETPFVGPIGVIGITAPPPLSPPIAMPLGELGVLGRDDNVTARVGGRCSKHVPRYRKRSNSINFKLQTTNEYITVPHIVDILHTHTHTHTYTYTYILVQ
jgi:hypothetical protein